MTDLPTQPSRSTLLAADYKWLAAALIFVLFRALPNLRYIIGHDQATYCLIGQGLLHGKLLYRDLWDNKPPGVFYIYAVIVKIFGPVMWLVGSVDIIWLLVMACCVFCFTRRYLGTPAAALTVVFYACRHCRQGYMHAGQAETFLMLFIFAAWFLLVRINHSPAPADSATLSDTPDKPPPLNGRHRPVLWMAPYLAVGLILGAAFWLKYNAVVFFPFLAVVPFVDFRGLDADPPRLGKLFSWKDWLLRALIVAAGFVLAVAAVLAYFRISGAWPAMREVQFEVMPRYGARAWHWNFQYIVWGLWQSQNHIGVWWEVMPAVALLIAWWRREMGRIVPLAVMALAGYTCTAVQGRFHPYYFETTYPFLAPFWGYVSIKTYQGFRRLQDIFKQRHWDLARGLLWVVFAGLVFSLLPEESVRVAEQYRYARDWWRDPEYSYKTYYWQMPIAKIGDQLRVIDYLKARSQPQDQVFVWGTAPLINFLSQREPPSRFVSNIGVMSTWAPESWRRELVRTLEAKRPRYMVVARHDMIPTVTFTEFDSEGYLVQYPALAAFLRDEYRPVVNFEDYEVYQLK